MSNFDFLKDEFIDLYELCLEAEKNCYIKPRTSAFYSRLALEFCVGLVYKFEKIQTSYNEMSLNDLINKKEFKDLFQDESQITGLNLIRKFGNDAAHMLKNIISDTGRNLPLNKDIALNSLKGIFDFTLWIAYCYGSTLKTDDIKFDEKYILHSSSEEENINNIKITNDDVKNNIEKIEVVPTKKHNTKINNSNFSEKETRKLFIDFLLMKAGWNLNDKNMFEYEVEGLKSTSSGKGNIDYVLWGDSAYPLAIIEAKKASYNAKKGEFQALEYAEALERKFNFFPIRFVTNGFEIFIYENKNSIPRRIYGFYRKEELLKIIARRNEKITSNDISINKKIIDRYYQERAVKKAIENYISGNRKSLLVMATGSGKTRVAISLVDCLSRLNMVKRTLFLADRVALVKQALNSFKNSLPDYTLVDLVAEKDRDNAKIVFSTYQTMMTEAEKSREDGTNKYGVGAFDLIIVDEAHRSIYQKYGDLFEYFDSLILGLTATPKNEIDRNTFKVFDMNSKEPTDSYDLFEAAKDEFLVLPKIKEISLNYPENGIVYSKLSEEEKEKYETLFDEEDSMPEEISSDSLNSWFFNEGTTSKVLTTLMEEGYKIESGDKLGKTIIFAKNDKHAEHIVETFNKLYKNLDGEFCQKITTKVEKGQTLIERFVDPNSLPQIAVSVDMLDTGIDVPQILNLVFYKKVKSKAKFWQMIGRGTRTCKNLFGPGLDKERFLIIDCYENFEFFEVNTDGEETKIGKSLSEKIFYNKIKIIKALEHLDYQENKEYQKYRKELIEDVVNSINEIPLDRFDIRLKRAIIEKYNEAKYFDTIDSIKKSELKKEIAPLITYEENDEMAKRFDATIYAIESAYLENKKFTKNQNIVMETGENLAKKGNIAQIQEQKRLIANVRNKKYWQKAGLFDFEEIREKLRGLIKLLDKSVIGVYYYTDFDDEIVELSQRDVSKEFVAYNNLENYQKRVNSYLEEIKDKDVIQKMRSNKPLTMADIKYLEKILFEEIGTKTEYESNYGSVPLLKMVSKIVGMDRDVVEKEFSKFLSNQELDSNQIAFVRKIIDYIVKNGSMEKQKLKDFPVVKKSGDMAELFKDKIDVLRDIVQTIDKVNNRLEIFC